MNSEELNNNMKKQFKAFFLGLLLVGVTFFAVNAYAQSTLTPTEVKLINPIGGTAENPKGTVEIPVILGGVIQTALTLMGSAALLMFVIGGVLWLTSAGNAERVKQGTQTMVWSAIGVLIIFSSYAILSLVLDGLGANNGGVSSPVEEKFNPRCMPGLAVPIQFCKEFGKEESCNEHAKGLCTQLGTECFPIKKPWFDGCKSKLDEKACKETSKDFPGLCVWKIDQKGADELEKLINEDPNFK